MEFRAGQSIFRQGERGERFYIVQEGAVTVSKTSNGERTMLAKLGEGAYFGERALIKDDVRHVRHCPCMGSATSDSAAGSMQHAACKPLTILCTSLWGRCGSALCWALMRTAVKLAAWPQGSGRHGRPVHSVLLAGAQGI